MIAKNIPKDTIRFNLSYLRLAVTKALQLYCITIYKCYKPLVLLEFSKSKPLQTFDIFTVSSDSFFFEEKVFRT